MAEGEGGKVSWACHNFFFFVFFFFFFFWCFVGVTELCKEENSEIGAVGETMGQLFVSRGIINTKLNKNPKSISYFSYYFYQSLLNSFSPFHGLHSVLVFGLCFALQYVHTTFSRLCGSHQHHTLFMNITLTFSRYYLSFVRFFF